MCKICHLILPVLLLGATSACAGSRELNAESPVIPRSSPQENRLEPVAPELQSGQTELTVALREALQRESSGWSLNVWCLKDSGPQSLEVFNGGVAVWGNRRQFRLADPESKTILKTLLDYDFPGMRAYYGGKEDPQVPGSNFATRIICQVDLEIGRLHKSVAQFRGGRQYPPLRALADQLLALGESSGRSGVGAESLSEGLRKISQGELAPELLSLVINRQPAGAGSKDPPAGWLLKIQAGEISRVPLPLDADSREVQLTGVPDEIRQLARQFWSAEIENLPGNLYAEVYTDLSLEILGHRKTIQARSFAQMDRNTHGARQRHFDQILRFLNELQERVRKTAEPDGE